MPRFQFAPAPSPDVVLAQYDGALFPKFKLLFDAQDESSRLWHFRKGPEEAATALVPQNRSEKAITPSLPLANAGCSG